jgi:uncharacterized protein YqgC (DUF456 family)
LDTITLIVLVLLTGGVIGSIIPMAPGALISLTGIAAYIFGSNETSLLFLIFALPTAVFAVIVDWFAGAIAAKYGGASKETSIAAGVAGLLGFLFLGGPLGLVAAVSSTVFLREYLIHGDEKNSGKAAFYATIGVLGSAVVQAMLTASILAAFLLTLVF